MLILKQLSVRSVGALAAVMGLLATVSPAQADDSLRAKQTAACKGDAVKLCTFAIPNEEKITRCMEKKKDKLSPKCRAFFDKGTSGKKTAGK